MFCFVVVFLFLFHNASFIILSISYNFWPFLSFYFVLMFDAFLVSVDLIFFMMLSHTGHTNDNTNVCSFLR